MQKNRYTVAQAKDKLQTMMLDMDAEIDNKWMLWAINFVIGDIALEPKLQELFPFHLKVRLDIKKKQHNPRWKIGEELPGELTDATNFNLIEVATCKPRRHKICYLAPAEFFDNFPTAEFEEPGTPCYFTMQEELDGLYLYFDKPIDKAWVVDMRGSYIPEDLISMKETIPLPRKALNIVLEELRDARYRSESDWSFGLAQREDIEIDMARLKLLLGRQFSIGRPTIIRGM